MTIAPQLFVGSEPKAEHFNPPVNDGGFGVKPRGGLWTSTYHPSYGSDWLRWCRAENFHVPGAGWQSWLLTPESDIRVLRIDRCSDLTYALRLYRRVTPEWFRSLATAWLDFERLAVDFDAVHLTARGQRETRLSIPHNLYGWDCESVLWLRWAFTNVEYLGRRRWRRTEKPKSL